MGVICLLLDHVAELPPYWLSEAADGGSKSSKSASSSSSGIAESAVFSSTSNSSPDGLDPLSSTVFAFESRLDDRDEEDDSG